MVFAVVLACIGEIGLYPELIRKAGQFYGKSADARFQAWADMIERPGTGTIDDQLRQVNDFFNRLRPVGDHKLWAREDYWATPFEAIGVNGADCEDYSLGKYFTLVQQGVANEKLRITYVKAVKFNEAHMVLAYYDTPDSDPLILDNIEARILPASQRDDLVPVYSFNAEGLWMSVNRAQGKRAGGPERIDLWKDFKSRLDQQMAELGQIGRSD